MPKNDYFKEIKEILKRVSDEQKEAEFEIKELRKAQKQTDAQIKRLGIHIGDLTDGWGKFVLGLSEPSILSSLKELGFNLLAAESPAIRTMNGEKYEIDILCPAMENGKINVIVIETKSSFNQQKVEKFVKKLQRFKEFFPEYSSGKLFGGIAGVRMTKETPPLAEKNGLYLFAVKEGMMKNINSLEFKPKEW
ncbi:MAG: hypothetical protein AB1567_07875 [bacterium]